jgi:hypothetical protein
MAGYDALLRQATIKAIDAVARKIAGPTATKNNAVTAVLNHWNAMTTQEKERVSGVIVATTVAAVTTLVAVQRGRKKTAAKTAKRVARKLTRR